MTKYVFIKKPTVILVGETATVSGKNLGASLKRRGADLKGTEDTIQSLFPDATDFPMDGEDLCMFAGKLCYNAFGKNGSKKTTKEYLDNILKQQHYSVLYHCHFSLYISGISRRIGEELKRHNIGTSVSQMSTRYCVHLPRFVVPPRYTTDPNFNVSLKDLRGFTPESIRITDEYRQFKASCKSAYRAYLKQIKSAEGLKGLEKKRVLEAAAQTLPLATETSMVFTFNPISARKFCIERTGETVDLEMVRFAEKVRSVLEERYKAFSFRLNRG